MLTILHNSYYHIGNAVCTAKHTVTHVMTSHIWTGTDGRTSHILLAILLAAAITFALRALPFLIFHGEREMPEFLTKLGAVLPAAIMAVLIVYCLKGIAVDWKTNALPQILAVLTVGISYKWKHNTLISIVAGTAVYMLLIHIL